MQSYCVFTLDEGTPGQLNPVFLELDSAGGAINAHCADLLTLKVEEERFFSHGHPTDVKTDLVAACVACL